MFVQLVKGIWFTPRKFGSSNLSHPTIVRNISYMVNSNLDHIQNIMWQYQVQVPLYAEKVVIEFPSSIIK